MAEHHGGLSRQHDQVMLGQMNESPGSSKSYSGGSKSGGAGNGCSLQQWRATIPTQPAASAAHRAGEVGAGCKGVVRDVVEGLIIIMLQMWGQK